MSGKSLRNARGLTPDSVIGKAAVAALKIAGFDIVDRPRPKREAYQWTCPHCNTVHAPKLGQKADVFADWGHVWCRACCGYPHRLAPTERGDRRPMRLEIVQLEPSHDP